MNTRKPERVPAPVPPPVPAAPSREPLTEPKIVFSLLAPEARAVQVAGTFCNWTEKPVVLSRQKDGLWKATVPLAPGVYEYKFIVDGQWREDPNCPLHAANPFGTQNSVRVVE